MGNYLLISVCSLRKAEERPSESDLSSGNSYDLLNSEMIPNGSSEFPVVDLLFFEMFPFYKP